MMTTLRTSRKSALFLTVAVIVLIITMLAFKDLNEKLDVMTASNAGYQKMTDSQSDKIRGLVSEINDLKGKSTNYKMNVTFNVEFLLCSHCKFYQPDITSQILS